MLDFLAISLGAVLGANLRFWMSRSMVRWLGPVFNDAVTAGQATGNIILLGGAFHRVQSP